MTTLSFDAGPPFHSTAGVVSDLGMIAWPGSTALLATWNDPVVCVDSDLTRDKQGWGLADVGKLYVHGVGDKFKLIIDETDLLNVVQPASYPITIETGTFELMVTMVYADPMGDPKAPRAAVNDLNLVLVSPSAVRYWGNKGLLDSNRSQPGGVPNSIAVDTVENVFVQSPEAGQWTVWVVGAVIVEDGHVETLVLDADFALVVSVDFDCNMTGDADSFDIAHLPDVWPDSNNNGIPDACESP